MTTKRKARRKRIQRNAMRRYIRQVYLDPISGELTVIFQNFDVDSYVLQKIDRP